MTEPTDGPTAASLQEHARRLADARRASGELPADIDDQLRDDVIRAVRRAADRGRIDTAPAIEAASTFPRDDDRSPWPRRSLAARARRLVAHLGEREDLVDALVTIDREQQRQARVVDDTAAQLDALAARITALERWAAVPGVGSLPGPALRTTTADIATVAALDGIALLDVLDDGSDPQPLADAAARTLRRGGRLVVRTDRPAAIVAALEGWLEVWVESLPAPAPLVGDDTTLVDRLNELLGLDARDRVVAIR